MAHNDASAEGLRSSGVHRLAFPSGQDPLDRNELLQLCGDDWGTQRIVRRRRVLSAFGRRGPCVRMRSDRKRGGRSLRVVGPVRFVRLHRLDGRHRHRRLSRADARRGGTRRTSGSPPAIRRGCSFPRTFGDRTWPPLPKIDETRSCGQLAVEHYIRASSAAAGAIADPSVLGHERAGGPSNTSQTRQIARPGVILRVCRDAGRGRVSRFRA